MMIAHNKAGCTNQPADQQRDAEGPGHQHTVAVHDHEEKTDQSPNAHAMHTDLKIDVLQEGCNGGQEHTGHEGWNSRRVLRNKFEIHPGRPEIKDHRRKVWRDAFFLCGNEDGVNETQALHQQNSKSGIKYRVQYGGDQQFQFIVIAETGKISGMIDQQEADGVHRDEQRVKDPGK